MKVWELMAELAKYPAGQNVPIVIEHVRGCHGESRSEVCEITMVNQVGHIFITSEVSNACVLSDMDDELLMEIP